MFSTFKKPVYRTREKGVKLFFCFFLLAFHIPLHAQQKDSSLVKVRGHSPKKAAIFSAIIPGSGQIYNRKYWKVPIIYAGFSGFGYGFIYNHDKYKKYKGPYILSLDKDTTNDVYAEKYSSDNLKLLMDDFHRWRDLNAIGITLFYVMNVIDAAVDAHLIDFNARINSDLTLNFRPVFISSTFANASYPIKGVRLTLTFN